MSLAVNTIVVNPFQPRRRFDPEKLGELAQSLTENGLITPIVVRQVGQHYQLIAGERRFRAAKMAGITTLPAIVRAIDDQTSMALALIENVQRDNLDVIEEAQAFEALMTTFGYRQADIAKQVGKHRSAITNSLRLLKLPDAVQQALQQKQIMMGHARALLGLPTPRAMIQLCRDTVRQQLSVRQVEQRVKHLITEKVAVSRPQSPIVLAIEEQLEVRFGTKAVVSNHVDGHGSITLNYNSPADLNRLLSLLAVDLDSKS